MRLDIYKYTISCYLLYISIQNVPSIKTAISYGCHPVDEFTDEK